MQQYPDSATWNLSFPPAHSRTLHPLELLDLKRPLYVGLKRFFRDVEIDVVTCPILTKKPYNLAAVGLCGNTAIYELGGYSTFIPFPRWTKTWDIKNILTASNGNSFVIGTGYAARPFMPYNGQLVINARYDKETNDFKNACRVGFVEESTRERKQIILNNPHEMACSLIGNLFVSEGKREFVLKVCVKRRKKQVNIITMIQLILYLEFYCRRRIIVGLGGVLIINNGSIVQNIMPQNYPPQFLTFDQFSEWFYCCEMNCTSEMIAVGTIVNSLPTGANEIRYGYCLPRQRYPFHSFSDYGAGGQFLGDVTPNTTEYVGYFNLAEKIYYIDYCT